MRHLGRDADDGGVDCIGGVALAYRTLGVRVNLPKCYALRWYITQPQRMVRHIEDLLCWPRVRDSRPTDLLLFRILTTCGDHPAILLDHDLMFHVWQGETRIDPVDDLRRRLVATYRPPCPPHR